MREWPFSAGIPCGIIAKYYFGAQSIIPVLWHKKPLRIGNYGGGVKQIKLVG